MNQFKRLKQFLHEVWAELKKTTWPNKKEVYGTTLVVITTVLICGVYLWVVDLILGKGMNLIFEAMR